MPFQIEYIGNTSSEFQNDCTDFIKDWESANAFIEVQTSGSTGKPKRFEVKKSAMQASARATGEFFGFGQNQTILLCMSPKYIGGKMVIVRAMEFGMKVLALEPSKNPLLEINQMIDFAAFVPVQVREILMNSGSKKKYEAITNVIIGGAQLGKKEFETISNLNNNSFQTFGMTETLSHFALKKISIDNDMYECLPGWEIDTKEGRLMIKANSVIEKDLLTNDIIEIESNGIFRFIGRADNAINSGGIKLFPEKIEAKLGGLIPNRFYISKKKDDKWGEAVVLVIESEVKENLEESLRSVLDSKEMPKEIIIQPQFKETGSGKVIREAF